MRLCANENISEQCVALLRQNGHDVLWIRETSPGATDQFVLQCALNQSRLLITFDKDFGELVFRNGSRASTGIILFRISQPNPNAAAERVAAAIASRDDWAGHFSVIDDASIRMRPLPQIPIG